MAANLESPPVDKDVEERISRLLVGAVDMHCHSGPSVMARDINHIQALQEASAAGFRAMLIKDHYYSATPITELLNQSHAHLKVTAFSGVPLNNSVGGFNKWAVDHGIALGAKLVWLPTFSARNHIDSPSGTRAGFPHTIKKMIPFDPLSPLDSNGQVRDDLKEILDMIAAAGNVILAGGHCHVSEILPVFAEAKKRGVTKFLVNHPSFIVGATYDQIRELAEMGAYIEHSLCMFIEVPKRKRGPFPPEELDKLIKAGTVEKTILASDLGQRGADHPVQGFRNVIQICMKLGYTDAQIKQMISGNPIALLGLEP
jgi:hypothetical protein